MPTAEYLPHASDSCVGNWQLRGTRTWRCSLCSATHPMTPETSQAAAHEFLAGVRLLSLTRQGRLNNDP